MRNRVTATADAFFDENANELVIDLKLSNSTKPPQTIRLKVSAEEAADAARDAFHSWIVKLVKEGAIQVQESSMY